MNIIIQRASVDDAQAIINIAQESWPDTYGQIISAEQINYMLQRFYNEEIIKEQLQHEAHLFLTAKREDKIIGYVHMLKEYPLLGFGKISKLYLNPVCKGQNVGKQLMTSAEEAAKSLQYHTMVLNVNRNNSARFFYEKIGYQITQTLDIPLNKFWLNDYVMEKSI